MLCTQCGTTNEGTARFCTDCGASLVNVNSAEKIAANDAADLEAYYKAVIGPKNQEYYLERFARFDARGKAGASWHWPAFFATFYWYLYRKMWLHALGYMLAPYALMFVVGGVFGALGEAAGAIFTGLAYFAYMVAIYVWLPMYANAMYYKKCRKKIAAVKASSSNVQHQLGELTGRGGTSNAALWVVGVMVVVAIIGILAAIAIPQYNAYVNQAKLTKSLAMGQQAADAVGRYYEANGQIPASLEEAGYAMQPLDVVRDIGLNGENGIVTITLAGGNLEGSSLQLIPSADEAGKVTWACVSEDVPPTYLPKGCSRLE